MSDKEQIKINHPEHGHVVFSQMSPRQMEILEIYAAILAAAKIGNDQEFGTKVRKLLNK
jgi:hypothetical protein